MKTAQEIADLLGRTRIARAVGNSAGAVTVSLKGSGKFPARYYKVILHMAAKHDFKPPLSAFNFVEPTEEGAERLEELRGFRLKVLLALVRHVEGHLSGGDWDKEMLEEVMLLDSITDEMRAITHPDREGEDDIWS